MSAWALQIGSHRRVIRHALTVGRSAHADIVLRDPGISRLQLVLSVLDGELELVSVGRAEVRVDGTPVQRATLSPGSEISIGEWTWTVEGGTKTGTWAVADGNVLLTIGDALSVGGGQRDGCRIAGAPAGAVQLVQIGEELLIDAHAPVMVGNTLMEAGDSLVIADQQNMMIGVATLKLVYQEGGLAPTLLPLFEQTITDVRFEFQPTGGLLTLKVGDTRQSVFLSELRSRLVVALLQPPGGYDPGDQIPDEVLCPMIWPGENRGRVDLNQIVHRTRQVLNRAGLKGSELLRRGKGGGSTAISLGKGCKVEIV